MLRVLLFLILMVVAVAGGWYLRGRFDENRGVVESPLVGGEVTAAGAARAKKEVESLPRNSKAYVVIAPEDLAGYVSLLIAKKLPPSSYDVRAFAEGDRVIMRAMIKPAELEATKTLGPLAGLLRETEELRVTGTFHPVRPGLVEVRVIDVRVRDLPVPGPLIPALLRKVVPGERPEGVSDNAIPVPLPEHVQDIRVSDGRMLVYRRVP